MKEINHPLTGYKAFNSDLTCKGFQYEIGETYTFEGDIEPCEHGFHFCKYISDCYNFYPESKDTRICKVVAFGDIKTDDDIKYVTNKIKIVEEITEEWRRKGNSNTTSTGYANRGILNSGNHNNGKRNSGDYNSGELNSGDFNSGDYNSGDKNSMRRNSGYENYGYRNSGDNNYGSYNSGSGNYGNYNSGFMNSGNRNSGDFNSGELNSGDFNFGNHNAGCFCNEKSPKLKFFNKDSNWTYHDWADSSAYYIMKWYPYSHSEFVCSDDMTEEEKEKHPEHKFTGGFVRVIEVTDEDRQRWWDELSEEDKNEIKSLPNFDPDIFYDCTRIRINTNKE